MELAFLAPSSSVLLYQVGVNQSEEEEIRSFIEKHYTQPFADMNLTLSDGKEKKCQKEARKKIECFCGEEWDRCHICRTPICNDHTGKAGYALEEWLSVDLTCDKCKQVTCPNCLFICYDCLNEGDLGNTLCINCKDPQLIVVPCSHHRWMTCGKHQNDDDEYVRGNAPYDPS